MPTEETVGQKEQGIFPIRTEILRASGKISVINFSDVQLEKYGPHGFGNQWHFDASYPIKGISLMLPNMSGDEVTLTAKIAAKDISTFTDGQYTAYRPQVFPVKGGNEVTYQLQFSDVKKLLKQMLGISQHIDLPKPFSAPLEEFLQPAIQKNPR